MNDLLNEIEKEIEVADIDTEMRNALNQAIGHARNVSSFILENYQKKPNLPGACGHNFLMMMGYLVGGWIAVRNITASKDALEEQEIVMARLCSIEKNSVIVALTTGDVSPKPAPKTPTNAII